jgi:hypothetical protein
LICALAVAYIFKYLFVDIKSIFKNEIKYFYSLTHKEPELNSKTIDNFTESLLKQNNKIRTTVLIAIPESGKDSITSNEIDDDIGDKSESISISKSRSESKSKSESRSESKSKSKSESRSRSESESKSESGSESESESESEFIKEGDDIIIY